jgi:hypothetical protein
MTEAENVALDLLAEPNEYDLAEAAALIREQEAKIKRLSEALRGFATPKKSHYDCYHGFYSCPSHPDYFGNDDSGECNCGADEHNANLERHADALRDAGVSP